MRVLIVGATGRIGSLTMDRALDAGHDVVALVRDPKRLAMEGAGVRRLIATPGKRE